MQNLPMFSNIYSFNTKFYNPIPNSIKYINKSFEKKELSFFGNPIFASRKN